MRNVLFFLAELNDQDLDWLTSAGSREPVHKGEKLIQQGKPISSLYLILDGQFAVTLDNNRVVAKIGQGELVGEISFLDSRPPMATVSAIEPSVVLGIPSTRLRSKLRTDAGFASRFYLSLGVMLAHRLRDSHTKGASGSPPSHRDLQESAEESGEFSPESLDKLNLAAIRFERILGKVR
jgi:CRP-like cAMP-binding protein